MPVVKPVKLLVKDSIPKPSFVIPKDDEIVGEELVLHTTPLVLILAPPSDVTLPPLFAKVVVMDVAAVVVANFGNKFPFRPLNAGKLICENPSKESSVKNNM